MKIKVLVLSCLVGAVILAFVYENGPAEAKAARPTYKVGIVSIQRIFRECKKNEKYRTEANEEQSRVLAELDKLAKEVEAEKAGLRTLKTGSSDHLALMKGILEKQANLQAQQEFHKQQMSLKDQQWTEQLYQEVLRETGEVAILEYYIGHDCGTVINPDIVRGMTFGGIAHAIGAALYEKFEYDDETGQHLSGSFMDYLLPSSHEVPTITMVKHYTPSPLTPMGQKGSGESGYLGGAAAIASAVNDALAPLGVSLHEVPLRMSDIEAAINETRRNEQAETP